MQAFNIFYTFDRRGRAKDKGFGAVEICISFGRKGRIYERTDVELCPPQWDGRNQVVVGSGAAPVNMKLQEAMDKVRRIITDLQRHGEAVTPDSYRARKKELNADYEQDFFNFAYDRMTERAIKDDTRKNHYCALDALRASGCVRTVQDLTPDNISRFDQWLRRRNPNMAQTTIHNYHKRIKVYVNEAIRMRLLAVSPYDQFRDVRGRSKDRIALTAEELDRIRALPITDTSLAKVRDVFVFCCYTGLSYADANNLTADMIVERDGRLFISSDRQKTGTHYYTPVLPPAREVLDKYNGKLPVYCQQTYNRMLKAIGCMANIAKPMSSHIARHTFATTVVLANDIPIETLSKMLGHRDIRVTQVYAKVLDQTISRHSDKLFKLLDKG